MRNEDELNPDSKIAHLISHIRKSLLLVISIICGTSPFAGDHARAIWICGITPFPKECTFWWSADPSKYLATAAPGHLLPRGNPEVIMALGRMGKVLILQFQAAPGDGTQSSPGGISWLKHFLYDLASFGVSFRSYGASVLDFYLTTRLFHLAHQHLNGLQDVNRFKTADHAGFTVSIHHGLVGVGSNDGGHVPRTKEAVYMHLFGRQKTIHRRRQ
jgi:hypothetical protein